MNRSTLLESISYVRAAVEELHEAHVDVPMDEETQTRFDYGVAAVASWTADLDALEARDAAIRDLPSRRPASSSAPVVTAPDDLFEVRDINRGPSRRTDMRDRALRVLETTADNFRETNHLDHVERLVRTTSVDPSGDLAARIVVCSDPDYIRGFGKLVTDQSYALSDPERRAVSRAVEVGVTTEGGFAVPTHLDATFIGPTTDGSANTLRALASVKTLAFGNTWNGISTGGVTAAMAAEEAEVADSSLVFAQPSIAAEKAHAYAIYSDEAAQDIDGLVSELGVLFSDAKDQLEATQMVTGSGTTPNTTGIVTGLVADTTPVTSATTDVFAVADVYALREAVGPRHRGPGFAWLAPLEIIDDIRQFGSAFGPVASRPRSFRAERSSLRDIEAESGREPATTRGGPSAVRMTVGVAAGAATSSSATNIGRAPRTMSDVDS